MEAAAKTVQLLTQRILPEKPHHLSLSPEWRYRVPPDEGNHRRAKHDEWEHSRLQYTTLVSEADRGVLFTRSYYDMRIEPPKPVLREVNALAKPGGEKKKLSLSDYKNKKTATGPGLGAGAGVTVRSETTPEPASARKKEPQRAPVDPKPVPENSRRSDASRIKETQHHVDSSKPHKVRDPNNNNSNNSNNSSNNNNAVDMRLPPKPPAKSSLPPRPVSPESRKRGPDADDDLRPPQKRPRPDASRATEERSRTPRDDPPRRKDRESHAPQDRDSLRDSRSASSSLLPNGRGTLKGATSANRNPSPAGRPRGDSINGVRPSTKNSPAKLEAAASSKSYVPPLLSPLHLNLGSRDAAENREKKRAREDAVDGTRPAKVKRLEPPPSNKRDKSPLRIPPLLSPTLPPLVEAELSRSKASPRPSDVRPREDKSKEAKEGRENKFKDNRERDERAREERPSATARKAPVEQDEEDSSEGEPRKTFIVILKIPKRIRQTVRRILAITTTRKEPQRTERSMSTEAPSSQAKKRPAAASETTRDTIAVKQPRPTELPSSSRQPPPPSTPSKKGTTAMSRVSSNNSQVNTPGEATTATPSAAPSSQERSITINGTGDRMDARLQNERHSRFVDLGRRLKHKGDVSMKLAAQKATNGNPRPKEQSVKLGYVLTIESSIAFMIGFQALNVSRNLSGKAWDPACWESVLPLLDFLQKELQRNLRRYQPIHTLVLILSAVASDEAIKCYGTFENPDQNIKARALVNLSRKRTNAWPMIREAVEAAESTSYCPRLSPWSTLEETLGEVLRILRRWTADENVEWAPEVNLKDDRPPKNNRNNQ